MSPGHCDRGRDVFITWAELSRKRRHRKPFQKQQPTKAKAGWVFEKVCGKQFVWKVCYRVTFSGKGKPWRKELIPVSNTGIQRKADTIDIRVALKGERRGRDGAKRQQAVWKGGREECKRRWSWPQASALLFTYCFYVQTFIWRILKFIYLFS